MKDPYPNALGQYRAVDAYGAAASDRLELITRLMQGAMDRLVTARGHMERREVAAKGENLGRAIAMIEGLRVSLDLDKGGEIARNLDALYDYMVRQLTVANLKNQVRAVDDVMDLLAELRAGWEEMTRTTGRQALAGQAVAAGAP